MKIYTRTGDDGQSHLCAGPRVAKDDPRLEACGTVDELNAMIGLARAELLPAEIDRLLGRVQHELFGVGADLAMPGLAPEDVRVGDPQIQQLEQAIDRFDEQLTPLTEFILPGGTRGAALLHLARTICRRAERRVVSLRSDRDESEALSCTVRYLNRLSDLLFMLSRAANARARVDDVGWRKNAADEHNS